MVIFLFLRNVWATLIPSVTVPLALIGTFAVMYLLGYSLDNLSLMALTIAVGFVVDDAIVMLENIYRHIEDGMKPMEAALKGAGEIGFTIISISCSLIAVFIPLLLMGGIVGRLFREFAVTVTIAMVVSAIVSLTLTPMMCSRFLRHEHGQHGRRLPGRSSAASTGLIGFYRRTLDVALRFQLHHADGVPRHGGARPCCLYVDHPQGLLPEQDTGVLIGIAEGRAGHLVRGDGTAQLASSARSCCADPDVAGYRGRRRRRHRRADRQHRPLLHRAEAVGRAHAATPQQVIARLRPKLATVEGVRAVPAGRRRTSASAAACRGRSTSTRCRTPTSTSSTTGRRRSSTSCSTLPQLRDVATDQQIGGTTATLTIDRDAAARFGIQPAAIDDTLYDAFGQRQVTQYFTQINTYHVILEVPPDDAGRPARRSTSSTSNRRPAQAVPLSTFVKVDTQPVAPLSISHQSQFPAVTISFNLAPGAALGEAVDAINAAMRADGRAAGAAAAPSRARRRRSRRSLRASPT